MCLNSWEILEVRTEKCVPMSPGHDREIHLDKFE